MAIARLKSGEVPWETNERMEANMDYELIEAARVLKATSVAEHRARISRQEAELHFNQLVTARRLTGDAWTLVDTILAIADGPAPVAKDA